MCLDLRFKSKWFFIMKYRNISTALLITTITVVVYSIIPGCSGTGNTTRKLEIKPSQVIQVNPEDTPEQIIEKAALVIPSSVQMAYHRHEFIAMICLGPNTYTGREWGDGKEDPGIFNPTGLDIDQWCRAMTAAGIRLVVLVVKHHDGFCLWQTRYTKHGVMSSPWRQGKGDVLLDLSISCEKYGLKLGVYLSPADLYQIESSDGLYGNQSKYYERIIPRPVQGRPFRDKRFFRFNVDDYNEYFLNQLFELLTEYGPIYEVWFDGAHPKRKGNQQYTYEYWYTLIRELAPEAVIFGRGPDVRWCGNEGGRTRDSEWNVIPLDVHPDNCDWPDLSAEDLGNREKLYDATYLYYLPAETNTSIRHGWFYRDDEDQQVRSADDVFDIYERAAGGNSVFMLNIPPNRKGRFSPRDSVVLEETGRRIRETYGKSLIEKTKSASRKLLDGKPETFWEPSGGDMELEIHLRNKITANRFVLQEEIANHGQRIEKHALDAWIGESWQEIAQGTTVGYKKILRFAPVETDRFRIRILQSRLNPTLSEISVHYYKTRPPAVTVMRNKEGKVTLLMGKREIFNWKGGGGNPMESLARGTKTYYTLDGYEPTEMSARYSEPMELPDGGLIKARTIIDGEMGPVEEHRLGIDPSGWEIISVSSFQPRWGMAENAFDGDPLTAWHTLRSRDDTTSDHPHHLAVDMGRIIRINGFTYLPPQDSRITNSMIEACKFEISEDGKNWNTVQKCEFGNILNDPSRRLVIFDKVQSSRYFRLTSLRGVENNPYAGAAEIEIIIQINNK